MYPGKRLQDRRTCLLSRHHRQHLQLLGHLLALLHQTTTRFQMMQAVDRVSQSLARLLEEETSTTTSALSTVLAQGARLLCRWTPCHLRHPWLRHPSQLLAPVCQVNSRTLPTAVMFSYRVALLLLILEHSPDKL
jgi:hypothetical protein